LSSDGTVIVDTSRTLRGLAFNNAASYTLSGAGVLTLASDDATGMPRIQSLQGSHTVSTALMLEDALTVDVAGATDTLTLSGTLTGNKALTKTGAGTLALSGNAALDAVTVSDGTLLQAGGTSVFESLTVGASATYSLHSQMLTLSNGLSIATSGTFNFQSYGAGTLRLGRGTLGGAIDTTTEFWEAVANGRITVKGQPVLDTSVFILKEEELSGVWYVTVTLKTYGTLLKLR